MVDVPPEVYELVRLVVHPPAASTLNMAMDSDIPFTGKHIISVLDFDTVRPNAAHTTTMTPSSFFAARVIVRQPRHRHHKAHPKAAPPGLPLR